MDRDNLQMLYVQILDCIDTIIYNSNINLKEVKKIINNSYKTFIKTDQKELSIKEQEYLNNTLSQINNNKIDKLSLYIKKLILNYNLLIENYHKE